MSFTLRHFKMPTKSDLLAVIFLGTTVISVISLVEPTLNYMQFYTAIDNLSFRISEINLSSSPQQGKVTITLKLVTANPTSYHGLKISSLSTLLYYENGEHEVGVNHQGSGRRYTTTWWKLTTKIVSFSSPRLIKPHSERNFSINLSLNINEEGGAARHFIGFLEAHSENIKWKLDLVVLLSSFISTSGVPFTTTLLYP